ncbi:MAG: 7TM domain-containing protein [Gammaproteobacteria bacterium]|nr:7TM domain-containing protein [Gammaproteobacteria bacterium]
MIGRTSHRSFHWLLWTAAAVLVVLWAIAAGLRYLDSSAATAAAGDRLWEVRISVQLDKPAAPEAIAIAAVPADTAHLRIIGQQLAHPGWRLRFTADPDWGVARQIRLAASSAHAHGFNLGFTLYQSAAPFMQQQLQQSLRHRLTTRERERYLRSDPLLGLEHDTLVNEVRQITDRSSSGAELQSHIFRFAHRLLSPQKAETRPLPEVIASGQASVLERANVMVALSRAANIPARLVTGLELVENREVRLHHWVEVYDIEEGWLAYDPLHGYQRDLPDNFLPFVKDRAELVEVHTTDRVSLHYSVTNVDQHLEMHAGSESGWQRVFYLTRLPLEVRNVLSHLLLLPLAVLLTTLFRELTGIRSYGTFMPALFALSLVYADWQMAAVTMAVVLLFGVLGLSALHTRFRRQPRLTVVLILVVLGVTASISLLEYFQWWHDGKVVLLPVVIMAILVDLFYRTLEKEGPASALRRLGWTLAQVALCLPVMQFESLGHWLVAHPETHLLTLAATLSINTYRGGKRSL